MKAQISTSRKVGTLSLSLLSSAFKLRHAIQKRWAEDRLQAQEKREAEIINFLPDPTFAIDRTGTVIVWNRAMEEMTGVRPSEILGRNNYEHALAVYHERRSMLADLILTPDPLFEKERYIYTLRGSRMLTAETVFQNADGTNVHLWGKASLLLGEKENIVGAIESIRDITDQKKAEKELRAAYEQIAAAEEELRSQYNKLTEDEQIIRENEEKYRELIENANSIILKWDESGIITFANEFAREFFGFSHKEIIGKPVIGTIVPVSESGSDRDLRQMIANIIRHPEDYIVNENENITRDGRRVWVRWHNKPLFDENGAFAGLLSIGTDITEHKRIDAALRESEAKFRGIFAAVSDGLALIDREAGTIIDCNTAVPLMYGYSKDEILGLPMTALSAESDATRAAITEAQPYIRDRFHKRKDGSVFPVEITVSVTCLQAREVIIAAIRDVTESRRAEEALQQANRSLALLTHVTRHDINNQLFALNGFLGLLHEKVRDPALEDYFAWISQTNTRISSMIQFASAYETVRKTDPVWQDIRILAETATHQISLGNVIVKNEIPVGAEVFADPLIVKVFYNLIDNSIRYGGKITTIRFTLIDREDNGIIVCEDDGAGIPNENKEKIFDRGFGKNTGLGLFLSREILSLTGITIHEKGEPGMGARFEITVPTGAYRYTVK